MIKQNLTTTEQERAAQARDPRIGCALTAPEGFAEYLAAGTPMMQRWSVGDSPVFYVGQALISAAVDCRRAGYPDPVPHGALVELYREYLPGPWRDRADLPPVAEGLEWASQPVLGASSCLQPRTDGTFLASDYLLDRTQEGDSPLGGSAVPDRTWDVLYTRGSEQNVVAVGSAAYRADRCEVAERFFRRAGTDALALRAITMVELGRLAEVEEMFREAARAGDSETLLPIAVALEFSKRFENIFIAARRAIEQSWTMAFLVLVRTFAAHSEDLYTLAIFSIDHGPEDMIMAVAAGVENKLSVEQLGGIAHHAVESDRAAIVTAVLIVLRPDATLTAALLKHAACNGKEVSLAAIAGWLESLDRFHELTDFAMTAVDTENLDDLRAFATYLMDTNRPVVVNELLRHATETGRARSSELLKTFKEQLISPPQAPSPPRTPRT